MATPYAYVLSLTTFILGRVAWLQQGHENLKYLLFGPLQNKFADPWLRTKKLTIWFCILNEILIVRCCFKCEMIILLVNSQWCIHLGIVFEWWMWTFMNPSLYIDLIPLWTMAYIYLRLIQITTLVYSSEQRVTESPIPDEILDTLIAVMG